MMYAVTRQSDFALNLLVFFCTCSPQVIPSIVNGPEMKLKKTILFAHAIGGFLVLLADGKNVGHLNTLEPVSVVLAGWGFGIVVKELQQLMRVQAWTPSITLRLQNPIVGTITTFLRLRSYCV